MPPVEHRSIDGFGNQIKRGQGVAGDGRDHFIDVQRVHHQQPRAEAAVIRFERVFSLLLTLLLSEMRNQMLSVQVDIAKVQVELKTTVPALNAQVLSLKTMLTAVNHTISTLNLQRFTAEVDALTTTIGGLQNNVLVAQGSLRDAQTQVAGLMQRTQTIDAAYHKLQSYNATVWSSLQNWTVGFQASSTSNLRLSFVADRAVYQKWLAISLRKCR